MTKKQQQIKKLGGAISRAQKRLWQMQGELMDLELPRKRRYATKK